MYVETYCSEDAGNIAHVVKTGTDQLDVPASRRDTPPYVTARTVLKTYLVSRKLAKLAAYIKYAQISTAPSIAREEKIKEMTVAVCHLYHN